MSPLNGYLGIVIFLVALPALIFGTKKIKKLSGSIPMRNLRYERKTKMYVLGIDVGSTSSKAVIFKKMVHFMQEKVIQAGTGTSGPERVLNEIMASTGFYG